MPDKVITAAVLEQIVKETVKTLEESREAIYNIAETARQEEVRLRQELDEVRREFSEAAARVDRLEIEEKRARNRLMEVSRDFSRYGEKEMQAAYEQAREYQVQLGLWRERESQLRLRRDRLESTLKNQQEMVRRAEELVRNVGAALALLTGELARVSDHLEELEQRHLVGLKILQAQEEERRRLAREIHDGPAQAMAGIAFKAELCTRLADIKSGNLKNELLALGNLARETLAEIRKIIFSLRPMMLDDLGLVPALYRFAGEYLEKYGLEVELIIIGHEERLDKALEIGIFRLIQEALNNVWKHAGVTEARVKLEFRPEKISLSIKDEGCGFDPAAARGSGYGLAGMQERVKLLDGKLAVKTAPGRGTEVEIVIPRQQGWGGDFDGY
ncbi:MAG: two-component system, NarL family, sensor histidine kinase DegS [Moorella sp. (in: firmicutes)]|nr:two-component system, NarL family, sensor histidine kinase DegS [Moorella sp. (in: firmicutes)]